MRILQKLYSNVFEYEYWIRLPHVWCMHAVEKFVEILWDLAKFHEISFYPIWWARGRVHRFAVQIFTWKSPQCRHNWANFHVKILWIPYNQQSHPMDPTILQLTEFACSYIFLQYWEMYSKSKSCVCTSNGLAAAFDCSIGTWQGCGLSTLLFVMHVRVL